MPMPPRVRFHSNPVSSTCGPPANLETDMLSEFELHVNDCGTCRQSCQAKKRLSFCCDGQVMAARLTSCLTARGHRIYTRERLHNEPIRLVEIPSLFPMSKRLILTTALYYNQQQTRSNSIPRQKAVHLELPRKAYLRQTRQMNRQTPIHSLPSRIEVIETSRFSEAVHHLQADMALVFRRMEIVRYQSQKGS